jgi:hypothetical protein
MNLIALSFLLTSFMYTQEGIIKITNNDSQKEIIIKESKRIWLKTVAGKKISGRFKIIDANTILIRGKEVKLSEIKKIKRHPLMIAILTDVVLIYSVSGLTLLTYFLTSSIGVAVVLGLSGVTYGIIKSPNILKGYKVDTWTIEIIEHY